MQSYLHCGEGMTCTVAYAPCDHSMGVAFLCMRQTVKSKRPVSLHATSPALLLYMDLRRHVHIPSIPCLDCFECFTPVRVIWLCTLVAPLPQPPMPFSLPARWIFPSLPLPSGHTPQLHVRDIFSVVTRPSCCCCMAPHPVYFWLGRWAALGIQPKFRLEIQDTGPVRGLGPPSAAWPLGLLDQDPGGI